MAKTCPHGRFCGYHTLSIVGQHLKCPRAANKRCRGTHDEPVGLESALWAWGCRLHPMGKTIEPEITGNPAHHEKFLRASAETAVVEAILRAKQVVDTVLEKSSRASETAPSEGAMDTVSTTTDESDVDLNKESAPFHPEVAAPVAAEEKQDAILRDWHACLIRGGYKVSA